MSFLTCTQILKTVMVTVFHAITMSDESCCFASEKDSKET